MNNEKTRTFVYNLNFTKYTKSSDKQRCAEKDLGMCTGTIDVGEERPNCEFEFISAEGVVQIIQGGDVISEKRLEIVSEYSPEHEGLFLKEIKVE
ncbi:hypothetical protein [Methanogenium organophilum]|uniref:Uncharacterized protein n=1 Tax=Methanogenium organophilum TaxID=2199 RepID=A0A9X9T8A4_METOG|nr:hypothetical protein [Methanogenium organophilum]WAI00957.1 hypothetical protein OU421_11130 [Methanogenium organophilum]